jgi:hypothetical protein
LLTPSSLMRASDAWSMTGYSVDVDEENALTFMTPDP